jgi:hypothetical protein
MSVDGLLDYWVTPETVDHNVYLDFVNNALVTYKNLSFYLFPFNFLRCSFSMNAVHISNSCRVPTRSQSLDPW